MVNTAIVLAGGNGSRMQSDVPKQYMKVNSKPILFYSLDAMERCPLIDEIVLVTRAEDLEYCKREIVEQYCFTKVKNIVSGGTERYLSVYNGLKCAMGSDYVWIHDGARPYVTMDILERLKESVLEYGSAVAAVPSKDTVKIVGDNQMVCTTPDRNNVWMVQTPQVFSAAKLLEAYENMFASSSIYNITDDAMIMERYGELPVHLVQGDYMNIKVTTPEDIFAVENYLKKIKKYC